MVAFFWRELGGQEEPGLADFHAAIDAQNAKEPALALPHPTQAQVERVRREVRDLASRWRAVAAGKTLALEFVVGA